jgi:hypothetical protein
MLVQENLLSTTMARKPVLRPAAKLSETDADFQSLTKLAQLKARLRHLDLQPEAPQAAALQRLLRNLSARGQKHVVFYAKENPALLPDVMDPEEHAQKYDRLVRLVNDAQGRKCVFVPPISELNESHFVDFTHVNADGYRILAEQLAKVMH